MGEIITSLKNSRIKYIKSLSRKKNRWAEKKYILEGIRSVGQLLENTDSVEEVIYSKEVKNLNRGEDVLRISEDRGVLCTEVSKEVFDSITMTESPQYIMAIAEFRLSELRDVLNKGRQLIFLDRIQDPGNLGTIMRTAEAMGFDGIVFTDGTVDIYNPKVLRSAMGVEIPLIYYETSEEAVRELKEKGIRIISSYLDTDKNIFEADLSESAAIVIGNEANGISDEIIAESDELVKIPMAGKAESLNAAAASAIIMYESMRQKICR